MKLNIVYRSICIIIYLLYSHIRENGKILPSIFIPHTAAFYNTLHFRCTGSEKEIMKLWTREGADKAFNLWIAYHLKRTGAAFPWLLQNPEIVSCYYIGRKVWWCSFDCTIGISPGHHFSPPPIVNFEYSRVNKRINISSRLGNLVTGSNLNIRYSWHMWRSSVRIVHVLRTCDKCTLCCTPPF